MTNTRIVKLQELLSESPDDVFLRYAISMEYMGMKEYNKAIDFLLHVLNLDSTHVPTYFQLGKLYLLIDEEALAIKNLESGLHHARLKSDSKALREIQALLDELLY